MDLLCKLLHHFFVLLKIINERWIGLRHILLELKVYDKRGLRQTVEGMLYRLPVTGHATAIFDMTYQRWFRR